MSWSKFLSGTPIIDSSDESSKTLNLLHETYKVKGRTIYVLKDAVGLGIEDVKKYIRLNGENSNRPSYNILLLNEIDIKNTERNICILESLNEFTNINKLNLASIDCWNESHLLNFLQTNTTIRNLRTMSFALPDWREFAHYLCQNSFITSLGIQTILKHPNMLIYCVATNTNLRHLDICANDELVENGFFKALKLNTILTAIRFNAYVWRDRELYEEQILNLIETTTSLKLIDIVKYADKLFDLSALAKSIVKNTSLNDIKLNFDFGPRFNEFLQGIDQNIAITRLEYEVWEGRHETQLLTQFLSRNKSLMWCNVHPILLNFTLIFHLLPSYIVLEIFDWLPYMDRIHHYKKIQLIINTKKSIDKLKN